MTERTPREKIAGVRVELVTLKARLTEPYRSNVEVCIDWLNDVDAHLEKLEAEREEA